ncbi:MAG TPA: hypothetical protein VFY36_10895 [Solirubrobacteraceae bacterium]|nr:hypothetical protein [Solirubrobacteraceae bacterium]
MTRIRPIGLALVAMFAFSAFAASTASAAQGPLWSVNKKHLKAGETRLLLVTAKENFELAVVATGVKIKCTGLTLPNAASMHIEGAAPGNGGKSKEVLQFTTCTVENNGEGCEVAEGKTITTSPVVNTLGFPRGERMGPILVVFTPEANGGFTNNSVFVTVKFTGEKCLATSVPVLGQVIGEAFENGHPVEVDLTKLGTESLHGEVRFIKPGPKTIWIENGGTLKTVKTELKLAANAATLIGTALLLVDENGVPAEWGVFW